MRDCIYRDDAIALLDCHSFESNYDANWLENALNELPSSDARTVVFCKNCRYCLKEDEHEYWCTGFCSPARLVTPDDYCSHGVLAGCQNTNCGYCEDGKCYNLHGIRVKHKTCPRGFGND